MEKRIKLRPKQLAVINEIQQQKQQLTKMFQDLNEKENLLITFVFESVDELVEQASEIKLDGEYIVFKQLVNQQEPELVKEKPAKSGKKAKKDESIPK